MQIDLPFVLTLAIGFLLYSIHARDRKDLSDYQKFCDAAVAQLRVDYEKQIAIIRGDLDRCQDQAESLINGVMTSFLSASDSGALVDKSNRSMVKAMRSGLFSKDELRAISFEVGINPEGLDDRNLTTIALSLMEQAYSSGKSQALCAQLRKDRPNENFDCHG